METIDIAALDNVTGGSKAKAIKTALKVGKKALEYGGRVMDAVETVGMAYEAGSYIKQGYDWMRGKKSPDSDR